MQKIKGTFTEAAVYSDTADDYALAQVKMICSTEAAAGSQVRLMPDVHPGKIGPVGLTMTTTDKVLPGLVGVDIGCGISIAKIKDKKAELPKLDSVIRKNVPAGFDIRKKVHHLAEEFDFDRLRCAKHVRQDKAKLSLGTLGGGNHFIELDRDEDKNLYLTVHTGSRHLGKEVADFYMSSGQKKLKAKGIELPYEMTCLEGELLSDYLHDLLIAQEYAALNRRIIIDEITKGMKWKMDDSGSSIHNYIGEDRIIRKGAISARKGEPVIIPINMRDGIILGEGLGNEDWNFSAPHGAGRIMNREAVKTSFTVSQYKQQMRGIYSTCIDKSTLDEAPFAYRGIEEIAVAIEPTVRIDKIIKPVYNFKAGGKE